MTNNVIFSLNNSKPNRNKNKKIQQIRAHLFSCYEFFFSFFSFFFSILFIFILQLNFRFRILADFTRWVSPVLM